MVLDVSGDWTIFDWTETITYLSRLTETTSSSSATVTALKRENQRRYESSSDGVEVSGNAAIWELWTATMSTPFVPKRGDSFTDASSKIWEVETVDYSDKLTRYRLNCLLRGFGG